MDAYNTLAKDGFAELVINKSRFLGYAFAIASEEQALERLEGVRKRHYDASHNCYAYVSGEGGQYARYSDDGEPSGTAGQPILDVLRHKSLVNSLVVVTRYFGGILLGAGGLVRAYSKACAQAVDDAQIATLRRRIIYSLDVPYPLWDKVQHALKESGAEQESAMFGQSVVLLLRITAGEENPIAQKLSDISAGKLTLIPVKEVFS